MQEANKRMTWDEIVEAYPDQWVGIADAELDGSTIRSGVVKYYGISRDELAAIQFTAGNIISIHTALNSYSHSENVVGCIS